MKKQDVSGGDAKRTTGKALKHASYPKIAVQWSSAEVSGSMVGQHTC